MPTYEYACSNCGQTIEVFQKITEEPLKTCPNCQSESLQRLVSATAFHLKGSGWYKTDYGSSQSSSAKSSSAAGGTSSESGKTESSSAASSSSGEASAASTSNTSSSTGSAGETK